MVLLDDDRSVATSMFEAGKALQLQPGGGAWPQALETYDELITRFQHNPDPVVARRVADALTWGAYICSNSDMTERALARYQQVIDMFGDRPEEIFRPNLAVAWGGKAIALNALGRLEERIPTLHELARRLDYRPWDHSEDETDVAEELAKGAVNLGGTLRRLDRDQEAAVQWTETVHRFADDPRPWVQAYTAWAATSLGAVLHDLGRHDEAVDQWNWVVTRFADVDHSVAQEQVSRAWDLLASTKKPWWRFW